MESSKRDWLVAIGISIGLILFSSLPYLYAFSSSSPELVYTGLHSINSADASTYLALIEQAKEGHVLLRILHTGEPHQPFVFRPLYLLTGWIARLFHLSPVAAYHVMRAVAGFALLLGLFHFLRHFFPSFRERLFGFLLTTLSAGFGWLQIDTSSFPPLDLWMPEAITFLTYYESPHFSLSVLLLIGVFDLVLTQRPRGNTGAGIAAGFLALWLAFEHPYDIAVVACVICVMSLFARLQQTDGWRTIWLRSSLALLLCLTGILYQWRMISTEPIYRSWAGQNLMPMPGLGSVLAGFGILVPLALAGIWWSRRDLHGTKLFPVIWCATAFLLAVMPFREQRRVLEGVHIPICILAAWGAIWLSEKLWPARKRLRVALATALIAFSSLTNLTIIRTDLRLFRARQQPFFLPGHLYAAMEWLRENATEDDVILSGPLSGNLIPGISGRRIFIGHIGQTVDFPRKLKEMQWYFRTENQEKERIAFLHKNGITLVFLGPQEGKNRYPWLFRSLEKVFENPMVDIYRVKP